MSDEVAGAGAPCPHCGADHPAATLKCPETDLVLPLAGRVLAGRFRLEREIGRGGMASVWLALNTAVDRQVAIKLIRPEVVKRTETVARFRSEARAAGRIEHPNICQIHDFGNSPIGPYMVMEYLRGRSLASLIARGKTLSVGVATGLVSQALAGLAAAHREGIVHRDLKPENVFVHVPSSGPPRVKLMDFGVSKLTDGSGEIQTEHGALLGTPEYMAPEQVGGAAMVDERCDLWAVGAMLYRALTGKLPFKGPTIAATLLELTSAEPRAIQSLAPHVPEALCELIMSCLAKDRTARPADADTLAEALRPWTETVDLAALVASGGQAMGDEPVIHGELDPPRTGASRGRDDADRDPSDDPSAPGGTVPSTDIDPDVESRVDPDADHNVDTKASTELRKASRGSAIDAVAKLAEEARALRRGGDDVLDDQVTTAHPTVPPAPSRARPWLWPALGVAAALLIVWALARGDDPPAAGTVGAATPSAPARPPDEPAPPQEAPSVPPPSPAAPATGAPTEPADGPDPVATTDGGQAAPSPVAATGGTAAPTAESGDTGEDMVIIDDDDDPPHKPSRPGARGRSDPTPEPAPPAAAAPDPSGTLRVGDYLVLARAGPATTHTLAKKYCRGLASAAHVGVTGWKLPNPAVARRLAKSKKVRAGRYWTSARHKGNARTLVLPRGELVPEPVDKKRVKALCVASAPRGDQG